MLCSKYQHRFFTTHVELNGESFKAYRMLIFNSELEIFIIMLLGVICTYMVDFCTIIYMYIIVTS